MKSFEWYTQGTIGLMDRPGFNNFSELSIPQLMLIQWLAQENESEWINLGKWESEFQSSTERLSLMLNRSCSVIHQMTLPLLQEEFLLSQLNELTHFHEILDEFEINEQNLRFKLSSKDLKKEFDFLISRGIERIVYFHVKELAFPWPEIESHYFPVSELQDKKINPLLESLIAQSFESPVALFSLQGIQSLKNLLVQF